MAVSGSKKQTLSMSSFNDSCHKEASQSLDTDNQEKEHIALEMCNSKEGLATDTKQYGDDTDCLSSSEYKPSEVCCCMPEKNDDINLSSDSLSSSASISDSDITSTDTDDSLALSESESITDVTPLNSPYCYSPLPQNKHIECQLEEQSSSCGSGDAYPPEMNVLMRAIEKLEFEAKNNPDLSFRDNIMRRRVTSASLEETKKIEQENQCLLTHVISQQNCIRTIYSSSYTPASKSISCRNKDLVKSDGEISDTTKKSLTGQTSKDAEKSHVHRRQKCLSHPSTFMYSCNNQSDKSDNLCYEKIEKKKCTGVKKNPLLQNIKNKCEERNLSSS